MQRPPMAGAGKHQEQAQESAEQQVVVPRWEFENLLPQLQQLEERLARLPNGPLVSQIIGTSVKLLRDGTNRGDVKLINNSLKELRYALKVFAPYREIRKVSIFGSARTRPEHPDYKMAAEFGRRMAAVGWMVITGAGPGIMAAGHDGAGAHDSFGLNISLPFEQFANEHILDDQKLINFKYFFTRKLMFLRSSHGIVLFPGGFGTMDEGFEVLTLVQTGKSPPIPIVLAEAAGEGYWESFHGFIKNQLLRQGMIAEEDLSLYRIANGVDEAVNECVQFYRNFHSLRYWKDKLIFRLKKGPDAAQLDDIREKFADINAAGKEDWQASGPLPVERNEPGLKNLDRLVFTFNRKDHGRLRMLIDHVNLMAD